MKRYVFLLIATPLLILMVIGIFHTESTNDSYCKKTYGSLAVGESTNSYPASQNVYCACQQGYELSQKTHQCVSPTQICKEELPDMVLGKMGNFISTGVFDEDPIQEIECIDSSGNPQILNMHGPLWFDKRVL